MDPSPSKSDRGSERYRVTVQPEICRGARSWMVYEAQSGAIIAKQLDETEARALCDQCNRGVAEPPTSRRGGETGRSRGR